MGTEPAASRLRWKVANAATAECEQQSLFHEPEREIGRGEFRGLEFVHVRARRIINRVDERSPLPFRYTINAYRGCSHSCTYCAVGETPILMADGCTKPLADVRAGDGIYGTERRGACRRYVITEVLDQWSTTKPAYRITLTGGAALVTSGDHRFLTDRGWKHVTCADAGAAPRPQLQLGDALVGTAPDHMCVGAATRCDPRLRVASVEPLGTDLPMYDITSGTGDFIADGVVSHNCFARPTHEYLGLDPSTDFDRVIVVKVNAIERLQAELVPSRWAGDSIAMGTNTDPYQRAEGKYRLTRGIVETLAEAGNPFSILTKGTLVLRDLDVLTEAAKRTRVELCFSIGTLDDDVWRTTEPGTPHPRKRVDAVARLNEAGIPCGVLVAPVLPGLSDDPSQLDEVVRACVEAGARSISPVLLHLRPGVREHYLAWLAAHRPDLVARHRAMYARGAYASREARERVSALVRAALDRHRGGRRPPLLSDRFRPAAAAERRATT